MDNVNTNHDDDIEISFEQIFQLIKKNMLFIIIFFVVGIVVAFLGTKLAMKEKYTATVKLYVDAQLPNQNININEFNLYKALAKTYIQMLDTNNFYQKVQEASDTKYTSEEIRKMISYTILNETEVFQIGIVTGSPQDSKLIADTIVKIAPDLISGFQRSASLRILDDALLPTAPSSPNLKINLLVGALLGVAIALLIAFIREAMDTTVKGEYDLIERYHVPVLVCIPEFGDLKDTDKIGKGGVRVVQKAEKN